MMIYNAKSLRSKENLNNVEKKPGYYKWWAKETEIETILTALELSYSDTLQKMEKCNIEGEEYYCIYIGIAIKESISQRLDWHINQNNTLSQIKNGTLSTFRRSIAAVVCCDLSDTQGTNDFIDLLKVETFPLDLPVKTQEAKEEIQKIEKDLLNGKYLYLLNIQENKHPMAPIKKLKQIRKMVGAKNIF